jgi:pyruvate formate lyase activating enzyme
MKEASFYKKLSDTLIQCNLCSHQCSIKEGCFGLCGVRENKRGVLYTYSYGNIAAVNVDPVEKKPLYHFLPGSKTFSFACAGCNFKCAFCQNWQISQNPFFLGINYSKNILSAEDLVEGALKEDCRSLSYTYTEPTIFFEYAYDVAKIAKKHKLRNIFVTNGYIKEEPLRKIVPYLDAVNIDLKFFKENSYKKFCNASLSAVLSSIELFKSLCLWVEVTTLVIPGVNDSKKELRGIADFIVRTDPNIPWHISRFYPNYQLAGYPITLEERLKEAQGIGLEAGVKFVYTGNVHGWGEDTLCPYCGKILIKRDGFRIEEYNIVSGSCKFCQKVTPGVFS